jgi:hypothetical protein
MLSQQISPIAGIRDWGLWNGLIPNDDTISIVIPEKACSDRMESVDKCQFPLASLAPGAYILTLQKPDPYHNISLTSDLQILQ